MKDNDITLHQIEMLLTVADQKSIAKAARQMHLDPAGVSRSIIKMEAILQTRLLSRTNQGVVLTEEGQQFYRAMKPLLHNFKMTMDYVRQACAPPKSILRIGVIPAHEIIEIFQDFIRGFRKAYPEISVDIQKVENHELREGLALHQYDCIVGYSIGFGEYEGFETKIIHNFDSYLIVSSASPAVTERGLDASKLDGTIVYRLLPAELAHSENRLNRLLEVQGIHPAEHQYVPIKEELQDVILKNKGITVSGKDLFIGLWPEVILYKLPDSEDYQQSMIIAWNKDNRSEELNRLITYFDKNRYLFMDQENRI